MLLILPPFYHTGLSLDSILWDLSLSPAPSVYSSILPTPLSLPTRVLATQSINSHLKDQRPPKFLPQMCLFVVVVVLPFPLSFLSNPFELPERVAWQSGTGQSITGGSGEAEGHDYVIAQIQ